MPKVNFDIGLIVPLKEEFQYLSDITKVAKRHQFDGTFFYELESASGSILACIIGEMGPLPASQATTRLLSFADVKLIAVVGVAGALDKDVRLADIVVADEVNEFLAKSKAIESDSGYQFKFSGRHTRIDFSLREVVNHFDISGSESLGRWKQVTAADVAASAKEIDDQFCNSIPKLHVGTIASGDVVGSATAFSQELLQIDRKFLAIDMEAAGVVKAAADRLNPIKVLVIRGVSDFADERKKELDHSGSGIYRKLSVRNAINFLLSLLSWKQFRDCIGLDEAGEEKEEVIDATTLIKNLPNVPGLCWGVGVFFGLHTQAPIMGDDGTAKSEDIGLARLNNEQLDKLVMSIEEMQSALECNELSKTQVIGRLDNDIEEYRQSLGFEEIEILKNFDHVVKVVLDEGVEGEDELDEVIGEVEKMIDDNRLPEAAIALEGMDSSNSIVRGLTADVYFNGDEHEQVVGLLKDCDLECLGRRELEHLISSRCVLGQFSEANLAVRKHKELFSDAAGKVFRKYLATGNDEIANVD